MSYSIRVNDDDDDDITKLIQQGEDMVKDLCSVNGKQKSGIEGFGSGIAAMFGLSGIKALQASQGRQSTDFIKKANSILQQTTQYYTLAFANSSVILDQDLFTLIKTSTDSVLANMTLMETILKEEDQLLQIQIYGVYLICSVIIFFLILLL
jgi:hypothetical protein